MRQYSPRVEYTGPIVHPLGGLAESYYSVVLALYGAGGRMAAGNVRGAFAASSLRARVAAVNNWRSLGRIGSGATSLFYGADIYDYVVTRDGRRFAQQTFGVVFGGIGAFGGGLLGSLTGPWGTVGGVAVGGTFGHGFGVRFGAWYFDNVHSIRPRSPDPAFRLRCAAC